MSEKLTIEIVKQKTLELLGETDPEFVAYITQEMVESDQNIAEEDDDESLEYKEKSTDIVPPQYGHNMRYSNRRDSNGNTRQIYVYDRGNTRTSRGDGCGSSNRSKWLYQNRWNHQKDGDCTSRDARIKFTRR